MTDRRPPEPLLADLSGIGARRLVRVALAASPELREGFVVTLVLALLAGAGRIVGPLTIQHAIDSGVTPRSVAPAVAIGAAAIVVAGTSSVLMNRRLQYRLEHALAALRRAALLRIHQVPAETVDRVPSADLIARLTSDVDQVTTFLQGGGIQFLTNAAQLVIATVVMFGYGWQLTLPVLVIAGVLLCAMALIQRVIARRYDQARRELSRMQSAIAESVNGVAVIRSTGTAERTRRKVDDAIGSAQRGLVRTLSPLNANTSLGELAISTMTVAVVLGGVWFAVAGDPARPRLTEGTVIAMIFLVTFFVRPLQFLVQSLGEAQNALTGWRRTLEVVTAPAASHADGVLAPGPLSVSLRDVSARYADGPTVLSGVTVEIAAGEHVAVVGHTGSGKSTFAKLITRRIEPAGGAVLVGGVPLASLSDDAFAGRIVIVPQDPFLFDETILHNVLLGRPDASEDEVRALVSTLGLDRWLASLPAGLYTGVGRRGELLSIGERQLVALIRTALVEPDLIVLDEATSGIDPATDVAIQHALATLTRTTTTISIAHRLITAINADRVLVFDAGALVQAAPHAVLAAEAGPYRALIAAWNRPLHLAYAATSTAGGSDDRPDQP